MVRVIYRFSVHRGSEAEFVQRWREVTSYIQRLSPGARGSVLLRSDRSSDEHLAVARWESRELWAASRTSGWNVVPALLTEKMKGLLRASTTHEVFDELIDFPPTSIESTRT